MAEPTPVPAFDEEVLTLMCREIVSFGTWLQEQPVGHLWFRNLQIELLNALVRETRSLIVGFKKSVPLLGWSCRNILELNVITKYVVASEANAKRFVDDWLIDDIDVFKSFGAWMAFHGGSSEATDRMVSDFEALRMQLGVVATKYLKTRDMASEVGFLEEYDHVNKVTSKLVHPTAFSLLGNGKFGVLGPILFSHGGRFAVDAFGVIKKHAVDHMG